MPTRSPEQIRRDIHDYVPKYYEDFPEVLEILESRAGASIRMSSDITEVLDQFFIVSATWALPEYERIFSTESAANRSIEARRSAVMSKMRGAGTATIALIKSVAESFGNGERSEERRVGNACWGSCRGGRGGGRGG